MILSPDSHAKTSKSPVFRLFVATISVVIILFSMTSCANKSISRQPDQNMSEVLGEEQTALMAQYELMEAEDLAYDAENDLSSKTSESDSNAMTEEENTADDLSDSSLLSEDDTLTETVNIRMVGDILLHTPVEKAAYDELADKYNYDFIFANTTVDISSADIAIVNEEVIIGGRELGISGYPAFNAAYEIGDSLVNAGFDVICHATNHAMDKGKAGITNCIRFWNEHYPDTDMIGIHESIEDSNEICVKEVSGIRIAFLNYTYGTNGIPLPEDMPYAVDMLDKDKVISDLERAEEIADFTVVIPHWGIEYSLSPSDSQRKWAQTMASHGADLIIGAHPHVIEPIEWIYTDDDIDDNDVLCYYSLGNFVNWTSGTGAGTSDRMVGGMADVTIEKDDKGNVKISDYGIIPLVCHLQSGQNGVSVYRFCDYTPELAEQNEIKKQDPAFSYDYCESLIEKVWQDLYTDERKNDGR